MQLLNRVSIYMISSYHVVAIQQLGTLFYLQLSLAFIAMFRPRKINTQSASLRSLLAAENPRTINFYPRFVDIRFIKTPPLISSYLLMIKFNH